MPKQNPHHANVPYDYVTVTEGPHKGQVFFYDDDEHDKYEYDGVTGTGSCAVLYPGAFDKGYILVPHKLRLFRPSTPKEIADHMLNGRALHPSRAGDIFRDILIEDVRRATKSKPGKPGDPPPDIVADTKAALDAVLKTPPYKRRKPLLWLGVLVKTWIELTETNFNEPKDPLIEEAEKALGKRGHSTSEPGAMRCVSD